MALSCKVILGEQRNVEAEKHNIQAGEQRICQAHSNVWAQFFRIDQEIS